jgi:hypothetical protein
LHSYIQNQELFDEKHLFTTERYAVKNGFFRQTPTRTVVTQRRNTPATKSFPQGRHTASQLSFPRHHPHKNVVRHLRRHYRNIVIPAKGGNPGKGTVHGETVPGNGKEPGKQDGEIFIARSALRQDSRLHEVKPPTGEPDAGDLPVRSAGKNGASQCAVPAPVVVVFAGMTL